jgi:hypothetical protein
MGDYRVVVDGFCQNYERVFKKPGDTKITANRDVKTSIIVNEMTYHCTCPNGSKEICDRFK